MAMKNGELLSQVNTITMFYNFKQLLWIFSMVSRIDEKNQDNIKS